MNKKTLSNESLVPIQTLVPKELKLKFKHRLLEENKGMSETLREFIEEYLNSATKIRKRI